MHDTMYKNFPDGIQRQRIPFQHEGTFNCHHCGTPHGQHHQPGCTNEQCPSCRGQAISCECTDTDDHDE